MYLKLVKIVAKQKVLSVFYHIFVGKIEHLGKHFGCSLRIAPIEILSRFDLDLNFD